MSTYSLTNPGYDSPAGDHEEITPSDTASFKSCRALYVGTTGDVRLKALSGNIATYTAVPAGQYLYVRATQVLQTGTTATNIVAMR